MTLNKASLEFFLSIETKLGCAFYVWTLGFCCGFTCHTPEGEKGGYL